MRPVDLAHTCTRAHTHAHIHTHTHTHTHTRVYKSKPAHVHCFNRPTHVQTHREVFRGLSVALPPAFFEPGEQKCAGGVEPGFMSTTTKRAVAVEYSGVHERDNQVKNSQKYSRQWLGEVQTLSDVVGPTLAFRMI